MVTKTTIVLLYDIYILFQLAMSSPGERQVGGSFKHKVLLQSWSQRQRGETWPGSSWPPPSTVRWGGRTPGYHQSRNRHNRLNIYYQIVSVKLLKSIYLSKFSRVQTVVSYLSSRPCCLCWPHGDQSEEMAALQSGPRLTQSPPAAQLRRGRHCHRSHQRQGKSEILL